MKYDALNETQRLVDEQERERQAQREAAQRQVAAMKEASAARIQEFRTADPDRREEMTAALRVRMQAAGDKPQDMRYNTDKIVAAPNDTQARLAYKAQEDRLTQHEIRRAMPPEQRDNERLEKLRAQQRAEEMERNRQLEQERARSR